MKRRRYIGLLGAGVLGGCSGGGDDAVGTDGTGATDTATESRETADGEAEASVADPSTVAFSERWTERFESDETVAGRHFGADATADSLFVGADWGLAALDTADGSRRWEKDEWEGVVDIHADSEGVIAYTQSFDVVSFDPSDGTEQWRGSTAGGEPYQLGTALTPSYFVVESEDGITVYERSSGSTVLELDRITQSFLATDGALVLLRSTDTVVFDIPSGNERWRKETTLRSGAVINDGRLVGHEVGFGEDADAYLKAFDLDSGTGRWRENLGSISLNTADIVTDNGVATFISDPLDQASRLYGHDLNDGSQLWSQDVGQQTTPISQAASNGVVIAPAADDREYQMRAYNVQNGAQLDATDVGYGSTEIAAFDRTCIELKLQSATAYEF